MSIMNKTDVEPSENNQSIVGSHAETLDSAWRGLCKIGGVAALIAVAVFIISTISIITLSANTANEYFTLLQNNRLIGLLRLYLLDMIGMALFFPMYLGLYVALRQFNRAYAAIATTLVFAGLTLWFIIATHSAFSMINLSDQYAAATTDESRSQLLAAGEMAIASDMWNSTGATIAGILIQSAAVIISVLMLRSKVFSKVTAYVGILGNGLDLVRININIFVPGMGNIIMVIAGPLIFIWMFLLGRRLYQLGKGVPKEEVNRIGGISR